MTNSEKTPNTEATLKIDPSELLILNGSANMRNVSADKLAFVFESGTKVGKP